MFGYRVPRPDEVMLISGGRSSKADTPFRVVKGNGAFVLPGFRHASFLTLAMQEAMVDEHCVTQQGIVIQATAVCAFKIDSDDESIINAAQRFLSDQSQMPMLTGRIFAGHLRSIIGSMTVEDIVRERQKLAEAVLDGSKDEMSKLGLRVDSFQIQSIDDGPAGYIAAMASPHTAAIQQAAKIAQAEADRAAAEAQQESERKQADYQRQTAIAQAQYRAEVQAASAAADQTAQVAQAQAAAEIGKATATANQAGPLAQATAERQVTEAQTLLAVKAAELRQQQLIAEVVAPAEAQAKQRVALATADAEAIRLGAAAAAENDRVSLDQLLIEQLPKLVEAAANGLQGSHLTVLNGSQGLTEVAAGLVNQALAIYDSARTANGANERKGIPDAGERTTRAGVDAD